MDYKTVKRSFFDLALGDILRALDGQSLVGAIILSLCAIDYLAFLFFPEGDSRPRPEQNKTDYRSVVEKYIVNSDLSTNRKYPPEWVYALRCALVHSYATSEAFKDTEFKGYQLIDSYREKHLSTADFGKGLKLNCESFIRDVIWGAWMFFEDKCNNERILKRSKNLLRLASVGNPEEFYRKRTYESFHSSLREFDKNQPDPSSLYVDIRRRLDCVRLMKL